MYSKDPISGGLKKSQVVNWLIDQPNANQHDTWNTHSSCNRSPLRHHPSSSELTLYASSNSPAAISFPVSQITRQKVVNRSSKSRGIHVNQTVSLVSGLMSTAIGSSPPLSDRQPALERSGSADCSVVVIPSTPLEISSRNLVVAEVTAIGCFQCRLCSKCYSTIGAVRLHWRTHTLPCRCLMCGKAFSRPWLLRGHWRTHTGERPFQCPDVRCRRTFADRSNLRAHLQTHVDVKKYGCEWCAKTFPRLSLLAKHKRTCFTASCS